MSPHRAGRCRPGESTISSPILRVVYDRDRFIRACDPILPVRCWLGLASMAFRNASSLWMDLDLGSAKRIQFNFEI